MPNTTKTDINETQQGSDTSESSHPVKRTSSRGFASMNRERQRQIASLGGKAAHAKGTAHEFTPDEAREAGRKGGRAVSQNPEHMAKIGRKGGRRSGQSREAKEGRGEEEQDEPRGVPPGGGERSGQGMRR